MASDRFASMTGAFMDDQINSARTDATFPQKTSLSAKSHLAAAGPRLFLAIFLQFLFGLRRTRMNIEALKGSIEGTK